MLWLFHRKSPSPILLNNYSTFCSLWPDTDQAVVWSHTFCGLSTELHKTRHKVHKKESTKKNCQKPYCHELTIILTKNSHFCCLKLALITNLWNTISATDKFTQKVFLSLKLPLFLKYKKHFFTPKVDPFRSLVWGMMIQVRWRALHAHTPRGQMCQNINKIWRIIRTEQFSKS